MAIGDRIRFIRNLRGITQKMLGIEIGFPERTADIRMAQYEAGTRTPKDNLVEDIARALDVSTFALDVPNIESQIGIMHTLFALEDTCGFQIGKLDNEVCIRLDRDKGMLLNDRFNAWYKEYEKFKNEEISKEEYDQWRYTYPEVEVKRTRDDLDKLREKKEGVN